jgi:signal transduction histidine kinase
VGTGLASMQERAALMGGLITVSSMPGHGTRVELHVPLPGRDPARDDVTSR